MKIFTTQGTLTPCAPFDFEKSLDFLGDFSPMAGEQALARRSLTKTISLNGKAVVFQISGGGTMESPLLDYTLYSAHKLSSAERETLITRIRFFLSLDDDLRPFYVIARRDEMFAPVVKRLYGLHQVKFVTPFENAVWAILTQRQPMRVAHRVKTALIEKYGARLKVSASAEAESSARAEGVEYRAFPEPTQLLAVPASELNGLVRNERKTDYLRAVIEAFSQVDETFVYEAPTQELREWLLNIKGIGDWSADFILLRGLGRMESMRMTEYSLRGDPFGKAIQKVYSNGSTLSSAQRQRLTQMYGDWQGYWAYYLRVNA